MALPMSTAFTATAAVRVTVRVNRALPTSLAIFSAGTWHARGLFGAGLRVFLDLLGYVGQLLACDKPLKAGGDPHRRYGKAGGRRGGGGEEVHLSGRARTSCLGRERRPYAGRCGITRDLLQPCPQVLTKGGQVRLLGSKLAEPPRVEQQVHEPPCAVEPAPHPVVRPP